MRWRHVLVILFHIIGWGLFLTLPLLLQSPPADIPRDPNFIPPDRFNPLFFSLITNISILPFFYLNLFVLFPKYIPNKKYGKFIASQFVILIIISLSKHEIFQLIFPEIERGRPGGQYRDFFFVFSYLFIMLIAFSYGMIRESIRKERIQKEKENETLKSELQFLRWQVNPHFLFNVLNNIVALARLKSEKLEPILIKLSTLLRYMLYEASETKISITKEVEYLQSYIDIQCLRIDKETVVTTKFDVFDNSYTIEPMLLIPLIENAFKHGIGLVQNPMINIEMEMNEGTLLFVIRNTYNKNLVKNDTDEPPGIGLLNVRRRLELIYKNKHTLDIDTNGVFTVTLKIDLG